MLKWTLIIQLTLGPLVLRPAYSQTFSDRCIESFQEQMGSGRQIEKKDLISLMNRVKEQGYRFGEVAAGQAISPITCNWGCRNETDRGTSLARVDALLEVITGRGVIQTARLMENEIGFALESLLAGRDILASQSPPQGDLAALSSDKNPDVLMARCLLGGCAIATAATGMGIIIYQFLNRIPDRFMVLTAFFTVVGLYLEMTVFQPCLFPKRKLHVFDSGMKQVRELLKSRTPFDGILHVGLNGFTNKKSAYLDIFLYYENNRPVMDSVLWTKKAP